MRDYAQKIEAAGAKLVAIEQHNGRTVVAFRGDGAPVRVFASAIRTREDVELALKHQRESSQAEAWEAGV